MKLETAIPLRKDGTVIVTGLDAQKYVFKPEESGLVVCDIDHEPTIAHLLKFGDNFFPVDEADFDKAESLIQKPAQTGGEATGDGADGGDADENDGDDPVDPNALPVEAGTPPAPAKAARGKAAAKAS